MPFPLFVFASTIVFCYVQGQSGSMPYISVYIYVWSQEIIDSIIEILIVVIQESLLVYITKNKE